MISNEKGSLSLKSETALELWKRVRCDPFTLQFSSKAERFSFGEAVEIVTNDTQSVIIESCGSFVDGVIVIITTGTIPSLALLSISDELGRLDTYKTGNIKIVKVSLMIQLIASLETLLTTLKTQKVLLLLEGIKPLLASQKTLGGTFTASTAITAFFQQLHYLCSTCLVTALWISPTGRSHSTLVSRTNNCVDYGSSIENLVSKYCNRRISCHVYS